MNKRRLKAVAREIAHDILASQMASALPTRLQIASCLAEVDATDDDIDAVSKTVTESDAFIVREYVIDIAESILVRGTIAREDRWRKKTRDSKGDPGGH